MVLLDTNVLVYARASDSPLFKKAKAILDRAIVGDLDTCISLQNLWEFYAVVTDLKRVSNPLSPQRARQDIRQYLSCQNIEKLVVRESTIVLALELAEKYSITRQNIYDTQLVATMLENGIGKILTDNVKHFSTYGEIQVENPFLDGLETQKQSGII